MNNRYVGRKEFINECDGGHSYICYIYDVPCRSLSYGPRTIQAKEKTIVVEIKGS